MTDPHVVSIKIAADWLGISYATAVRWAREGTFPGLIKRAPGKRSSWLVSVPKFDQEVHGVRDNPMRNLNLGERREGSSTSLPPAAEVSKDWDSFTSARVTMGFLE